MNSFNYLKCKLNNKKGVSILYALLLFLVVCMVSITIIGAASSSVYRTNSMKYTAQDNITLDSAALLFKNNINKAEVTLTKGRFSDTYSNGRVSFKVGDDAFNSYLIDISSAFANNNQNFQLNDFKISETNTGEVNVSTSLVFDSINNDNKVIFELLINKSTMYITFDIDTEVNGSNMIVKWSGFTASGTK